MIESSGSGYGDPGYSGGPGTPGYGWYPPPPPPPKRGGRGILSHLGVAVLAAAVAVGATLALDHPATTNGASASSAGSSSSGSSGSAAALPGASAVPQPASSAPTSSSGSSSGIQTVVNKVEPGMVIINTTIPLQSEEAAGTGMVINSDGLVLTNNHVIEGSSTLTATVVATGKTYKATVVGYDATQDVALIKLEDAPKLTTVPLGNSSTVKTGTPVVALGNAEGGGTVLPAAGTITGLNQSITASDEGGTITSENLKGLLETNADIVSGDSGGPLSTASGQVIGMDTAGQSSNSSQGENLGMGEQTAATGYAIPINTALSIASEIAAGKASSIITIGYPPFVGIYFNQGTDPSPEDQAEAQGGGENNPFGGFGGGFGQSSCVTDQSELEPVSQVAPVNSGALVAGVICDSPAAAAGMTAGSVITAVNGKTISTPNELASTLAPFKPDDTITITWANLNGQSTTSTIHLQAGPPA
jgi:S1-C subfamily serine protease